MASAKQKRKKFIRPVSGKARVVKARKKTSKLTCFVCNSLLHGVPHGKTKAQIARLSKSEKKPSALFGGILCTACRRQVMDEAALVNQEAKGIQQVDLSLQKFVQQAVERIQ